MIEQKKLFSMPKKENDWKDHYFDMPEYNNIKQPDPYITATFKFRNQQDFDYFKSIIKKNLYNNQKVFDGMQRKNKKQAWYPLPDRPSHYYYADEK